MAVTTIDIHTATLATRRGGLEVAASFADRADAARAVERLADQAFPVGELVLVGEGLAIADDDSGRHRYGPAAGVGALGGAFVAATIGLAFGLLGWFDPLISTVVLGLAGPAFGAVLGAAYGVVAHASTRDDDAAAPWAIRARRYELLARPDVADEVRSRLAA